MTEISDRVKGYLQANVENSLLVSLTWDDIIRGLGTLSTAQRTDFVKMTITNDINGIAMMVQGIIRSAISQQAAVKVNDIIKSGILSLNDLEGFNL